MTEAADPERAEGPKGAAVGATGGSQRQQRMCITAAALAATVLLALVADRLSCRCGPALAARWLQLRQPEPPYFGAPNFILLSLDGGATRWPWEVAYRRTIVASGARNPNGCRIPMTWFTSCCHGSRKTGECNIARAAFAAGHELATHTMTHPDKQWLSLSYDELAHEIGGQRSWLVDNCSIPQNAVRGFRAPGFRTNDAVGRVLADLGFKYDSSHLERSYRQQGGALDAGFELTLARLDAPHNWSGLPLFEVPAYRLPGGDKRMDPMPAAGMTIRQRLRADFERKRGSGVPVPVLAHIGYLNAPDVRAEVVAFLRWALAQPNTWALTYSQYVAWLEAGPAADITQLLADQLCDRS